MIQSPLRALHERLGARFTRFGDWEMPLQYAGVIAEHDAVRHTAGIFDVSHLGRFALSGDGALATLRRTLCNDIATVAPGRAQYTMLLNDHGGIEDDLIVWWLDEASFWVLPNAANETKVIDAVAAAGDGAVIEPKRPVTVMLAVQGPDAPEVLEQVLGVTPGRFRIASGTFAGAPFLAAGTGYTGEPGAEVCLAPDPAAELFEALVAAGAAPCGLGARDTLRLEQGYPLWGQDLDPTGTPLEAGLAWVVSWDHDFVGKRALEAQRDGVLPRRLVGFRTRDRRVPRHGYRLRAGGSAGTVTSGNFSPGLGCGIGLGYLSPAPGPEAPVQMEARGRWYDVDRAEPPFI
ncbi:MAG: glycine cleavage system aminomethyltransferase GcvT [Acidimicrobiia bacterium]|jgi:aminomethyltransferase